MKRLSTPVRRFLTVGCCMLAVGCPKRPPTDKEPSEPTDTTATKTSNLDEQDVRHTVGDWLAAQNNGELAAYEVLYADAFEGIKRVAKRTARYDRSSWLADRRRMFKKKMTVTADNMVVTLEDEQATVEFEQTWSSGTFSDVGTKRLVIIRTAAGSRIAREEMLTSTVVRKGAIPNSIEGIDQRLRGGGLNVGQEDELIAQMRARVAELDADALHEAANHSSCHIAAMALSRLLEDHETDEASWLRTTVQRNGADKADTWALAVCVLGNAEALHALAAARVTVTSKECDLGDVDTTIARVSADDLTDVIYLGWEVDCGSRDTSSYECHTENGVGITTLTLTEDHGRFAITKVNQESGASITCSGD